MLRHAPWPRLVVVGRGWRERAAACHYATATAADADADADAGAAPADPSRSPEPRLIRNVAVIAHVDHGKTTLMDALLRYCDRQQAQQQQQQLQQQQDRAMDNLALERERGITILAKTTSLAHRGHVINAVDTPGHADFAGEVERALRLVDGCLLLVDAVEGPMVQTKFVLQKALRRGLRPVVVLSRADRPEATPERLGRTASAAFDLFAHLGASDAQLDFPVLAASGRGGWARRWEGMGGGGGAGGGGAGQQQQQQQQEEPSMAPLLDAILAEVPAPCSSGGGGDADADKEQEDPRSAPFRFAIAMIERDPYVGRVATGRVVSGRVRVGDRVRALRWAGYRRAQQQQQQQQGEAGGDQGAAAAPTPHAPATAAAAAAAAGWVTDNLRVTRLEKRAGAGRLFPMTEASAGDVVLLAGAGDAAGIGDTVAAPSVAAPVDPGPIDPPTLAMVFAPNDSPFAGRSGKAVTGRALGERLAAEAEASVSLELRPVRRAGPAAGEEDEATPSAAAAGGGSSSPPASSSGGGERHEVRARGELQLGVLLEGMRREGLEVAVSPPAVVMRRARTRRANGGDGGEGSAAAAAGAAQPPDDGDAQWHLEEPVEEVRVEVPSAMAGAVIDALTLRRAELLETETVEDGAAPPSAQADAPSHRQGGGGGGVAAAQQARTILVFEAPSRGLIGFRAAFSAMTRGEGVLQRQFARFAPHRGELAPGARGRNAVLVSTETGRATAYALHDLLPRVRGAFFVAPGEDVYAGQVIAEAGREGQDLDVNPTRGKKLTNVRTHAADEALPLPPARPLGLEEALGFCGADELVEVTPERVRVRKAVLDAGARRRAAKAGG
jgi:GTP-binding protein